MYISIYIYIYIYLYISIYIYMGSSKYCTLTFCHTSQFQTPLVNMAPLINDLPQTRSRLFNMMQSGIHPKV